jgi:hypothetical protein
VKFLVNVLTGTSVSEASKAAKISMTTALYWMDKIFAALASWQDSIVLSGGVYVDEKHFTVAHSEVELRPDGKRYRGLSRNQWCVARGLGARQEGDGDGRGEGQIELGEGARRLQKPHKTRVGFDPRPRFLALRADREAEAGGPGREGDLQIQLPEQAWIR